MFDYTDLAGWHYSGTLPFVSTTAIAFEKDVSSSPPGMAKVLATLVAPLLSEATSFSVDNPGRPNGPQLDVLIYLAFPSPKNYKGPFPGAPCNGINGQVFSPDTAPYGKDQLTCVLDPAATTSAGAPDGPEMSVDALLSTLANGGTPVINFAKSEDPMRRNKLSCNVWFKPGSLTLTKNAFYTEQECGKLRLSPG